MRAVRAGELDRIVQLVAPLDVLAQQIVAEAACEDWQLDDLFNLFRRATPFRTLTRESYLEIVDMLATGVGDGGGRAPPLIHFDRINGVVRGRRAARLTALQNGGTIPELGDYRVLAEPDETFVGSVNEDFAIESIAGDIFLLGNTSWQIRRVVQSTVRVVDAHGAPPTIPFWLGEAPGRTIELSQAVGRLRRDVAGRLTDSTLVDWLQAECNVSDLGAHQIADYLRAPTTACASCRPTMTWSSNASSTNPAVCNSSYTPIRPAHQPRLGPGAAQAILRPLRLRTAGRRQRRRHSAVAGSATRLPARGVLPLCHAKQRAEVGRTVHPLHPHVPDALALEPHPCPCRAAAARREEGSAQHPAHAIRRPDGRGLP